MGDVSSIQIQAARPGIMRGPVEPWTHYPVSVDDNCKIALPHGEPEPLLEEIRSIDHTR